MSVWSVDKEKDSNANCCSKCGEAPRVIHHMYKDFYFLKCERCGRKSQLSWDSRGEAVCFWNYANKKPRDKANAGY